MFDSVVNFLMKIVRWFSLAWEQFLAALSLLTEMQLFLFLLFILFFFHLFYQDRLPMLNKHLEKMKEKRKRRRRRRSSEEDSS